MLAQHQVHDEGHELIAPSEGWYKVKKFLKREDQ